MYKSVQVNSSAFIDRIAAEPPPCRRIVKPEAIVNEIGFDILNLRRESNWIGLGDRLCRPQRLPKRSVIVIRRDCAVCGINQRGHVPASVINNKIDSTRSAV